MISVQFLDGLVPVYIAIIATTHELHQERQRLKTQSLSKLRHFNYETITYE